MTPTSASLDRLLGLLVAIAVATGALALVAGTPSLGWVFALHGLGSGALLWAVVLKLRASLPRAIAAGRRLRLGLGLVVATVALAALVGGLAWVAAGRPIRLGPWTLLTLHAWAGLALVPLVAVHLVPRRWRLLRLGPNAVPVAGRRVLSRRALLAGVGFAAAALALPAGADVVDRALGGVRRFTGSRPLPDGGVPPTTTFLGEAAPSIDPGGWRLRVTGRVGRVRSLSFRDLEAIGITETVATLDCTSGWSMTTRWHGVRIEALVDTADPAPDWGSVTVRSVTGWSTSLRRSEIPGCLLATGVAGGGLPHENGAPCRLVVPTRRGVDWVKWVAEIEIS